MNIYLKQEELKKILVERFGESTFQIFYTEPDEVWEQRTHKKIKDLISPPDKNSYYINL